jgi:hypothetical protein
LPDADGETMLRCVDQDEFLVKKVAEVKTTTTTVKKKQVPICITTGEADTVGGNWVTNVPWHAVMNR